MGDYVWLGVFILITALFSCAETTSHRFFLGFSWPHINVSVNYCTCSATLLRRIRPILHRHRSNRSHLE